MSVRIIYEESPIGPLVNHIVDGKPVLANNWGFGVDEDGRPYFDTGMATPGQHAHLELVAPGRVAIVTGQKSFGAEFTGRPLRANPPNHVKGREFTGRPLRANPPNHVKGREFTGRPLRANPPAVVREAPVPRKPPKRDGTGPYQRSR